jgi:hypothetical protein
MPEQFLATDRTRVVREAHRAVYDRESIYRILDEGFVCHVGFAQDGQPVVIRTMYARVGEALYFHGSAASRMLRLEQWLACLRDGHARGWIGVGAIGFQSLDELPLSSHTRPCDSN